MKKKRIGSRLDQIGKYVPYHSRLADIGSDHAYLPINLVLTNKIDFAIASDISVGSLKFAYRNIKKKKLNNKILVRLGYGLETIERKDQISVIVISGMGGYLIQSILEKGKKTQRLTGKEDLILQANVFEHKVREWLVINDYRIIDEEILEEKEKIYEIIFAQKKKSFLSEQEILFGPFLMKKKNNTFLKKWTMELEKNEKILQNMYNSKQFSVEKWKNLCEKISSIKKILI